MDESKLEHGLYRIYWRTGGYSYAALGSLSDGSRWIAPTNWIGPEKTLFKQYSEEIDRMEFLQKDALTENQMASRGIIKKLGNPLDWKKLDEYSEGDLKRELTRLHVYSAQLLSDSLDDHNNMVILRSVLRKMAYDCFGGDLMDEKIEEYLKESEEFFEEMSKEG